MIDKIASQVERDMDLILFEELETNVSFQAWFLASALPDLGPLKFTRCWRSIVRDGLDRFDLAVVAQTRTGSLALLIENRVEPDIQAHRRNRSWKLGQMGVQRGAWSICRTSVVAPESYLATCGRSDFDCRVSYEAIGK